MNHAIRTVVLGLRYLHVSFITTNLCIIEN